MSTASSELGTAPNTISIGVIHSKRLDLFVNNMQRMAGVGNYWEWIEVPELANGLEIPSIVSPLRYDVIVRRDFFSFYATHRDSYASNRDAFIDQVQQTSYYVWFVESEAVRTNRTLRQDPAAAELAFADRVDRAVALYESVQRNGFSKHFPITLKTAKRLLPPTTDRGGPPTGKHVAAQYFLADGCHRLALLMALGYQVLPPGCFRVKRFQEFSPFDSTSLLARRLMPDTATYFTFLSSRYTAPVTLTQRVEFLSYIRKHKPELMDEVLSVIRADGFDDQDKFPG